jgi:hypothetical protein
MRVRQGLCAPRCSGIAVSPSLPLESIPSLTSRFGGAGHQAKGAACSPLVERIWDKLDNHDICALYVSRYSASCQTFPTPYVRLWISEEPIRRLRYHCDLDPARAYFTSAQKLPSRRL